MIPPLPHLALLGLLLPAAPSQSSPDVTPAPIPRSAPAPSSRPTLNHTIVFLDPAHGGDDTGARLSSAVGEPVFEKDLTLALAGRLRAQLASFGLTVLSTREPEPPGPASASSSPALSPDARAGLANHVHPFACIILHATASGNGVHLVTSALPPPSFAESSPALLPWDSAQAGFLQQSDRLAAELSSSIARTGIPAHISRGSVRPLSSLTCPAVLIELAPLSSSTSSADTGYQARVAQAVATALLFWRGHADPPAADSLPEPGSNSGTTPGTAQP